MRARAVGNADRDRHVVLFRRGFDRIRDRRAVVGVFVDDRDRGDLLARFLHVVEEAHVGRGIVAGDRRAAEHPFEAAAGDVEGGRVADHERNAVALRHCGGGKAAGGLIGAQQHVDLVLRDQARRQLLGQRRIALMIDEDQLELGAAQVGQAFGGGERQVSEFRMLVVDDIGGDFGRRLRGLPGGGGIARERPQNADLDRPGGFRRRGRHQDCGHGQRGRHHRGWCSQRSPPEWLKFAPPLPRPTL